MTKTILSILFISAILITGAIVSSIDLTQFAEAIKSKGTPLTKVGSGGSVICGDKLCSEVGGRTVMPSMPEEEEAQVGDEDEMEKEIDYSKELSLIAEHEGGVGPLTVTPFIGEVTKQYPEFYVPGTEELDENEMRIFACGTGTPWVVLSQAASCFLVQTAAGHNLIFDMGGGSVANLNTLGLSADELTDVFASHLHVDHIGDFDMFWGQGFMWGRTIPLTLHGPSSTIPELGTASFVENFLETWAWDLESKRGLANSAWHKIIVHEFDYSKTQVVYEENGLTVTSFPTVHGIDGPVSYRIEWNEMSIVYSGDTNLNRFLVDNSKDVDVFILQVFPSAEQMAKLYSISPELAQALLAHAHLSPEAAGVILELNQPRVPLIFHMNLVLMSKKKKPLNLVLMSKKESMRKKFRL